MSQVATLAVLLSALLCTPSSFAAAGRPSPQQQQRLASLLRQADKLDQAGDSVRAFLALREAIRLEQIWTSNTADDETLATEALRRFSTQLTRRDDGGLMKILHSRSVLLGDKLSLVRILEQEVLINYPGVHAADELLQGYQE